jgi:acyl-CoA thioesterase YciA
VSKTIINPPNLAPDPPGIARMLEIIFPGNTNSLGTAFGGHILSLMDKAAAFAAGRYSLTPVVTASIDKIDFRVPIKNGDALELIACVESVGNTSMRVRVDVFKENRATREQVLCTTGHMVMISIGSDGKPCTVKHPT